MPNLELHRRKVFRSAALYVAIAWAGTEIITFVLERFGFPEWTITLVAVLFVAGFPVAMFLEWTFEMGPDGIRRTPPGSKRGWFAMAAAAGLLIAGTTGLFYLINPTDEAGPRRSEAPFAPPPRSIAVLPFDVFAADSSELEWLGDGFAETLLHYLAQRETLHVIARTSAFSFKNRDVDVREIGRELNVATILEGSVQRAADTFRISAQLIDTRDGRHLWSQVYDRPGEDLFEIQDGIAQAVAARLTDALTTSEPPINRATSSPEAYELYLLGRYHWRKRDAESILTAIDYFEQAIAADPDYALAYSGLADAYSVLPDYSPTDFAQSGAAALNAARTAVELAPDLAEGHASIGLVHMRLGDLAAADAAFRQAIALNPNYSAAHHWRGRALALSGKFGAARRHHARALEFDPLAPVIHLNLGLDLAYRGLYDQAIERYRRAIELSPDMVNAYFGKAVAHYKRGDLAESARWFEEALALGPATTLMLREAALLYLNLEDDARADGLLRRAATLGDDELVHFARRQFFLARGQPEELVKAVGDLLDAREDPMHLALAGFAYHFAGDCETALRFFETLPTATPPPDPLFDHLYVWYGNSPAIALLDCYVRLDRSEAARALLAKLDSHVEAMGREGIGGPPADYFAAQLAAVQGRREPAIAHLARAVEGGWRQHRRAKHDPALNALRSDERFAAIIAGVAELVRREQKQVQRDSRGS